MRRHPTTVDDVGYGLSIGDLMAALLLIFVLILSATLLQLQKQYQERAKEAVAVKELVEKYKTLQDDLYRALNREFERNLKDWNAEIEPRTLIFRFKQPDVLFDTGESTLKDHFKTILNDFFPRYIGVLTDKHFKDRISEVRIEGHTSSEWKGATSAEEAYFQNMRLSQDRTRSVLRYVIGLVHDRQLVGWLRQNITANGLSSSHTLPRNGVENPELSRRVEFRVLLDLSERLTGVKEDNQGSAAHEKTEGTHGSG